MSHAQATPAGERPTDEPSIGDLPTAAVLDDGSIDIDDWLCRTARALQLAGVRVRGLVMIHLEGPNACARPMVLVDIQTRQRHLVSQPLGPGSSGCRADPQGFAAASRVLRRALEESPELVICNRFGGLEAEGGGFADEMLELMACGVPLLTVVAERHLEAWQRFSGGARVLSADDDSVLRWLRSTLYGIEADHAVAER